MIKTLPTLSQCYSLLLQEENQLSLALSTPIVHDFVVMVVKNSGTRFQIGKVVKWIS